MGFVAIDVEADGTMIVSYNATGYGQSLVGGTVVDHEALYLHVGIVLANDRLKALPNGFFVVIG
jgi:hypothetical protein